MLRYWFGVLYQAIASSFGTIGQSWFGFLYGALVVGLGAGLVRYRHGAEAFKEHLSRNVLELVAAVALAWFPFFVWHLLRTPYLMQRAAQQSAASEKSRADTAEAAKKAAEARLAELQGNIGQQQTGVDTSKNAEIARLRSQLEQKENRKKIRETLGAFLEQGRQLMIRCGNEQQAAPETEANQWAEKTEAFLRSSLGEEYVARFRNSAGLPLTATSISEQNHRALWSGLYVRTARLEQFLAELRD